MGGGWEWRESDKVEGRDMKSDSEVEAEEEFTQTHTHTHNSFTEDGRHTHCTVPSSELMR